MVRRQSSHLFWACAECMRVRGWLVPALPRHRFEAGICDLCERASSWLVPRWYHAYGVFPVPAEFASLHCPSCGSLGSCPIGAFMGSVTLPVSVCDHCGERWFVSADVDRLELVTDRD